MSAKAHQKRTAASFTRDLTRSRGADGTMLAFAKESYDVTDEILKSMGVDPAKRKEKKNQEKKADAGK